MLTNKTFCQRSAPPNDVSSSYNNFCVFNDSTAHCLKIVKILLAKLKKKKKGEREQNAKTT